MVVTAATHILCVSFCLVISHGCGSLSELDLLFPLHWVAALKQEQGVPSPEECPGDLSCLYFPWQWLLFPSSTPNFTPSWKQEQGHVVVTETAYQPVAGTGSFVPANPCACDL